jgi:RND family efflux transporter MFP subunit
VQTGSLNKLKILLPIAILLATLLLVLVLFTSTTEIRFKPQEAQTPTVTSISLSGEDISIPIYSRAFIEPEFTIQIRSQVAGQVTAVSPGFLDGASFNKGDILVTIDDRLLRLEYSQAKAALEQAKVNELELEARFKANKNITKKSSPLAQGKPQLDAAIANTEAAREKVLFSKNQLENASIKAAFNGRIEKRFTHLYDQLQPGKAIANIYSTESFILKVSINQRQLNLLSGSGQNLSDTISNPANIAVELSQPDANEKLSASVTHIEKQLNQAQQLTLIVKLDEKFNEQVLPGSLYEVTLTGSALKNIVKIPVTALRQHNNIWLIENDQLNIHSANVIYRGKDYAYLTNTFNAAQKLITSNLSHVSEGMTVKEIDTPASLP